MKKVLIAKDLAYADNKSSAGANTALNPALLREGAIGIYGIPKTSANNKDKLALIIDGASGADAAGKASDEAFDGQRFVVALGTSGGAMESIPIDVGPLQDINVTAIAYVAPAAQVTTLGYTSAGGLDNLPTLALNDVLGVTVKKDSIEQKEITSMWEILATAAESHYSAIERLADKITNDVNNTLVTAKVGHNLGAGSAFANSATVTAVKGATSLTTSANHSVDVGDYFTLGGDLYKAITGTATTTLVLDRPYRGASATIANAATADLGATAPTQFSLVLTGVTAGQALVVTTYGVLEDMDHTLTTPATQGQNTAAYLAELENKWKGFGGTASRIDGDIPQIPSQVVSGATYDVYIITYKNALVPKGEMAKITDIHNVLVVAFPAGGSAGGQAEFEDVMGQLLNGADGIGGID